MASAISEPVKFQSAMDEKEKDDYRQEVEHVEKLESTETSSGESKGVQRDEEEPGKELPMTFARRMSLIAMAFLWTGSQIPLYFFGGIPPYIYGDLGGVDRWTWFVLAYLLSLGAVCPFVGSLSDLWGRRYVALGGTLLIMIGMVVASTAQDMNVFIGSMTLTGIGAGVNELTALAVTSELAPTSQRGKYVAILVFTIIPFCPSVLWGQLIAFHAGWRWCGLVCGVWAAIGFVLTLVFYFPPARVNSMGLSRMETAKRIDYIGGFLSVFGMILFMSGLQWSGAQYKWNSSHVLAPMFVGLALMIAFVFWQMSPRNRYPMFPARMKRATRILALTLLITFISGANFFSILMFWPTQAFNMYSHDPVGVGVRGIPIGFSILAGACIVLWLLSVLRGHNKELLIASSVLMTAGCGSLAVARPDNLSTLWILLIIAGLGIGGIVVPASIITTIICPDDLIATIAALTLSIRVIGGSIGYCVYYNVFINKFTPNILKYIGGAMEGIGITNETYIADAIGATSAALLDDLKAIPGIAGNNTAYDIVVAAGQLAYAESYKWVYYVSLVFGTISIIAACFLGDISTFMDDHIAVTM